MMKFFCLIVIILRTVYVINGNILTGQCLASNGKCGTKGLTCEQKFGPGWINKGTCCHEKPCCEEEESTVKPEITYSCGFETTAQCFFKLARYNFDWTRGSGSTPTSGTGPTSAAEGIYYMFIETTINKRPDSLAVLDTDGTNFQACPWCLSFQYHMNGPNIGSLRVYTSDNTSSLTRIWTITGQQPDPDSWKTATIDIPQYSNLRVCILRLICN
ncbi:MAM domain-containing glycosylphosphatidylinositol anchor protein 1-like [Mytilus edulis]|uniref:MAM domain-containing glycosylphosphatidylinositol anchor protein 1-like n=1 Tax=Mytilus edulis TaxID=6550 RepID=UPI0039F0F05F